MDFTRARRHMVDSQILPNRVTDPRIVAAMGELPREAFVPEKRRGVAYVDEAIPLGRGRFLMEPMVVARLIQEAEVRSTDVVLAIGCGTGYATAVLGRLVSVVVALECDPELAALATETLRQSGIDAVSVVEGTLQDGYPKEAPYDVIFFDGAAAEIPSAVTDQLAEGGRLVAIVDAGGGIGRGTLVTRFGGVLSRRDLFDAGTPTLPGLEAKPASPSEWDPVTGPAVAPATRRAGRDRNGTSPISERPVRLYHFRHFLILRADRGMSAFSRIA